MGKTTARFSPRADEGAHSKGPSEPYHPTARNGIRVFVAGGADNTEIFTIGEDESELYTGLT